METHDQMPLPPLIAERITEQSGYALVETYPPDVLNNGLAGKAFFDRLGELRQEHRERNVLSSFFLDAEGGMWLGLFVRPVSAERFVQDVGKARTAGVKGGRVAVRGAQTDLDAGLWE